MMRPTLFLAAAAALCVDCSPFDKRQASATSIASTKFGPRSFVAAPFPNPTNIATVEYYSGYEPTQTSVQPQPKVTDPVRNIVYPLNLTDPKRIPEFNDVDPIFLPPSLLKRNLLAETIYQPGSLNFSTVESLAMLNAAFNNISTIIRSNGTTNTSTCTNCVNSLVVAQRLMQQYPWEGPSLLVRLCSTFAPGSAYGSCEKNYGIKGSGGHITSIIYYANVTSFDGRMICAYKLPGKFCATPPVSSYDKSRYFNTTLPAVRPAPVRSGTNLKVLHLSDWHVDSKFFTGSEAQCDGYMCCRSDKFAMNATSASVPVFPAPRFGAFKCDTPYQLAMAALEAIPKLTGTSGTGFAFTIYTGDIVAHDNDNAMTRDYVEHAETLLFQFFKDYLGAGPTFAALGNHDSLPQALNALRTLVPTYLADTFGWNYNHLASLWLNFRWIDQDQAEQARTHYGGFSVKTKEGLRVISYNSDNLYTANSYNFINSSEPDNSGTFKWVADELQLAELRGEKAWLISHIPAGFSGRSVLPNPSDLLNEIVQRYSPHVIVATFNGHTHEDGLFITYANNGTVKSAATALTANWIGPSLTPLTNLNSAFRMYEIDSGSFEVMESHTWYSNVTNYAALDRQVKVGPTYEYEYSAREAYGANITWPATAPLNATWWHRVTEQMERQPSLISSFHSKQGRLSTFSGNCTSTLCQQAKVCYIRAGTAAQGLACPTGRGFSSVQSK